LNACHVFERLCVRARLLPGDESDCTVVLAAYRRRWPHRVAEWLRPACQRMASQAGALGASRTRPCPPRDGQIIRYVA